MKPVYNPSIEEITLEALLHALSDPVRLRIIHHLIKNPCMSCTDSCKGFSMSKATLSRHYDVLRTSGLVFTEKNGVHYTNRVRKDEINRKFPGVLNSIMKSFSRGK